ncbi:MAG: glycerol-3-phosphate dehydrogenase [Bacteroidota bacterium]|nr:glycerol-3-phosphate dehydrogenase [Bacteroidota bacterium]
MIQNIAVIGSGSWATALVKIFSECSIHVQWLVRTKTMAEQILETGNNPRYLSSVELHLSHIQLHTKFEEIDPAAEIILFALPSAYLQETVESLEPGWLSDKQVAVSIKGFIPGTGNIPSVFLKEQAGLTKPVMVLGGPCHAEEIAMGRNTYVTIACENHDLAEEFCKTILLKNVHAIPNNDPRGVEYVAILKNIIGIATGIADGLNYGQNFQAVLVSNAMREVRHFLEMVNPVPRDLFDSAYFGDLLVTAYSDYSRNRTLGKLVGRGIKVTQALHAMEMVAEGYHASEELSGQIKGQETHFPIISSVYRILHRHASAFHEFRLIETQLK